ncbi:50S ribosomal protein L29 [Synechococcales cyanobacterium C]|uniref:Large ribosomal subunit protein uL29 n=1 Tax=Petrachloros mirabilis ULC683 TaxID=2781853 RepID=A0A8K2A1G2_9CYAN|nr:50S ribosomal protein L29 [Petrachloros mirabilis]NCJ08026.1 50S ribosomal protein L29 [Petrachloros mirabilis ULC683]
MALTKISDLEDLTLEEVEIKIQELKRQLFDLRFQQATRQAVKPHEFKHARHTLAQLMTLKHQRHSAGKSTAAVSTEE